MGSIQNSLTDGKLFGFDDVDTFTLPRIVGAKEFEIDSIAKKMNIPYLREPVLDMLSILPPITELAHSLPKRAVPSFESLSKFEPVSNSWVETLDFDQVGGYRVRGEYRNRYVVRTANDLKSNSVSFVSAEIAKHFQSAVLGRALFAYDYANSKLIRQIARTGYIWKIVDLQ
jgi:hypothetical protein